MSTSTYNDKGPECPHCHHVFDAPDDAMWKYADDLDELECSRCGRKSEINTIQRWTWICEPYDESEE
jgi:Zn ribbon nucleic-acid-binding protein